MADGIRFEKHFQQSTFRNPMMGNQLDTQKVEIRTDPLTGQKSLFNPRLEDKVAIINPPSDLALIERQARESEPKCFICGERWKLTAPAYPDEIVPGGRVQKGEAVLFPNLFPVYQVHAVIRVGERHYVPLAEFAVSDLHEAFLATGDFARALSRAALGVRFLTLNANYLGPAGASIAHPHFQVVGGDIPFNVLENLLARGGEYRRKFFSCYWTDLVEKEKELGERYIGRTGTVDWLTSFSPAGTNEVLGILPSRRELLEMDEEDWLGLALGVSAVLKGYGSLGISTFNFGFLSGPLGSGDEAFRCQMRIISRQNVHENPRADDYFMQKILGNQLILNTPEFLATKFRAAFTAGA
ncbi:MAG: hypothetical protein AB1640_12440 [bacterium]